MTTKTNGEKKEKLYSDKLIEKAKKLTPNKKFVHSLIDKQSCTRDLYRMAMTEQQVDELYSLFNEYGVKSIERLMRKIKKMKQSK